MVAAFAGAARAACSNPALYGLRRGHQICCKPVQGKFCISDGERGSEEPWVAIRQVHFQDTIFPLTVADRGVSSVHRVLKHPRTVVDLQGNRLAVSQRSCLGKESTRHGSAKRITMFVLAAVGTAVVLHQRTALKLACSGLGYHESVGM